MGAFGPSAHVELLNAARACPLTFGPVQIVAFLRAGRPFRPLGHLTVLGEDTGLVCDWKGLLIAQAVKEEQDVFCYQNIKHIYIYQVLSAAFRSKRCKNIRLWTRLGLMYSTIPKNIEIQHFHNKKVLLSGKMTNDTKLLENGECAILQKTCPLGLDYIWWWSPFFSSFLLNCHHLHSQHNRVSFFKYSKEYYLLKVGIKNAP